MTYDNQLIENSIVEAIRDMTISDDVARASDIAFHMVDWLGDFIKLQEFYKHPHGFSKDEISDILMDFLLHVPDHVAAAKKLISGLPVTDVFEIGALSEE